MAGALEVAVSVVVVVSVVVARLVECHSAGEAIAVETEEAVIEEVETEETEAVIAVTEAVATEADSVATGVGLGEAVALIHLLF